jgi:carbon monoxide dehydrogenase subunit G
MALQFEHSFAVKASPEAVWAYLTDPFRVAPALPGASITEKVDDSTYAGGITVKVGPVSAKYRGTVQFAALDPVARTAEIVARGQDTSGRGGADMRMKSRIAAAAGGGSEVTVVSEVNVTGIMAQFGRGLMQDVSNQMLERFTESMRAELEKPAAAAPARAPASVPTTPPPPAAAPSPAPAAASPPLEVSSVVFRQPAFWLAALALVAALIWFLSR